MQPAKGLLLLLSGHRSFARVFAGKVFSRVWFHHPQDKTRMGSMCDVPHQEKSDERRIGKLSEGIDGSFDRCRRLICRRHDMVGMGDLAPADSALC